VTDSVRTVAKLEHVTDEDIEKVVKEWLKGANKRCKNAKATKSKR